MTKDNWIKDVKEIITEPGYTFTRDELIRTIELIVKPILKVEKKKVEKDTIEKTNKRWREKYLGWEKEVLKLATDKQYLKSLADVKSYGLTDLFEEKE